MKISLLYAALSVALATPAVMGKSELETLRSLCAEQERQIKQLEEENSRLRTPAMEAPVPKPQAAASVAPAPVAPAPAPTPAAAPARTHEIKQGETYYSISRIYGISPTELAAANPKIKASALRPGQVLTLVAGAKTSTTAPAKSLATAATPQAVSMPKPPQAAPPISPEPEKSKPSLSPEKKIRAVSVENKMTYGEFATQHGTNPERLNELNGLDLTAATVLAKGSELYVPAQP